ncbi:MAG: outer membrane protein assembly factor BamE [Chthoniobacterales bacterium]
MNILRTVFALVLVMTLAACNSQPLNPMTQEKLDKVQEGMSATEVKSLLGSPTDSKSEPIPIVGGTKTTYVYTHDNDRVVIVLKNDTVQSKEGHFSSK